MRLKITAQIKQHAGDMLSECQDSFDMNIENLSFAVADGVSQAYRPELWSRLLTKYFVQNPETFFVWNNTNIKLNSNHALKDRWEELVEQAYEEATDNERFLLDMKRSSINIGASTFIGVQFKEDGIQYFTIGDSVLFFYSFQRRKIEIISSMLGDGDSLAFNNSPEYIDTNEQNHGSIIEGRLDYEDGIILMATDALSDWIVEQQEAFEQALGKLTDCKNHKEYDTLINELRSGKQLPKLKDDDTTFIVIEISEANSREITTEFSYAESFENLIKNESVIELKKRTEQFEAAQGEISRLETSIRRGEKALKALEQEKSTLENSLDQERKDHGALRTQYSKLRKETNESIKNLEQQLAAARTTLGQRKKEIGSQSDRIKDLEKKITELEGEIRRYKKNVTDLNKQIGELNKTIQSSKTMNATAASRVDSEELKSLQTQLNTEIAGKSAVLKQIEEIKILLAQIRQAYDASECCLTNYDALLTLLNLFSKEGQIIEMTFIEKQSFSKSTGDGGFQLG